MEKWIRVLTAALLIGGLSPSAQAQQIQTTPQGISAFVGSNTRDLTAATGSQAITGVGFKPSFCSFFGTTGGTLGTYTTLTGVVDSALHQRVFNYSSSTAISLNATFVMAAADSAGTVNYQVAAVSSLDSDGFTLAWTKNGSPTGTFTFAYSCSK